MKLLLSLLFTAVFSLTFAGEHTMPMVDAETTEVQIEYSAEEDEKTLTPETENMVFHTSVPHVEKSTPALTSRFEDIPTPPPEADLS